MVEVQVTEEAYELAQKCKIPVIEVLRFSLMVLKAHCQTEGMPESSILQIQKMK